MRSRSSPSRRSPTSSPGPGWWEIRGIAWSGRGKITRVDVSADGGKTWQPAKLDEPVLPKCHTRFRLPWEWKGGEAVIMSRATDETGYVQPTYDVLLAARGPTPRITSITFARWKVHGGRHGEVRGRTVMRRFTRRFRTKVPHDGSSRCVPRDGSRELAIPARLVSPQKPLGIGRAATPDEIKSSTST